MRRYRWEWLLRRTPEELWPLVSDTNRFNRDAGVPAVERLGPRRLRLRRYGVPIEWDEEPFEWVRPHRFGVVRRYRTGPLAEMRVAAELFPRDGGTLLRYTVEAEPRGLLGRLSTPVAIGVLARRRFGRVFAAYDRALRTESPPSRGSGRLEPGGRGRLERARERLAAEMRAELAARLAETLEHGDSLELAHLRPYALADAWAEPRRDVLELCLRGVRHGALELEWRVLCPLCRGAAQSAGSLAELTPGDAHCESCGIRVDAQLDRSVEIAFRPSASIRATEAGAFCVGGPQVTPHVVAQQLLAPGEERELRLPLEPGAYRLRSPLESRRLTAEAGAPAEPGPDGRVGLEAALRLANPSDEPLLVSLERTAWSDQAATAADVASLQVFRDLFAREALRPGEQIAVGGLAVLFTDLRDSTRFYREVGDAPAFGAVLSHLDLLRGVVSAADGAVVKTMGDAVMAVFRRPIGALEALARAQELLPEPLVLKAGVHYGPCIAVTQEDRLDYFGSTVNAAARLVGLSTGGDVVLSAAVLADPEVASALAGKRLEPLTATLKGFEDEPFELFRVRP